MAANPAEDDQEPRPDLDHAVGVYDTDAFLVHTVVDFVRPAIEGHAMAAVALGAGELAAVERALTREGLDVAAAKMRGDYAALDAQTAHRELTAHDRLDTSAYWVIADRLAATAGDRGCELRVTGNLHSMLWAAGEIETVLELEGTWNVRPGGPALRLLCLYSPRGFRNEEGDDHFIALCKQHAEVKPVEDYASLVGPTDHERAVSLLEQQADSNDQARGLLVAQREQIEAELDRCLRRTDEQRSEFRRAIVSRDIIGQAKGILMVRWHIDADTAFAMLRDASNRSRRKVHDVAVAVVEQQLRRN